MSDSGPQNSSAAAIKRILVVEDEESLALGIRDALEHAGYEVSVVHDGLAALAFAKTKPLDLMVLDIMLPGMNGIDVLRRLREEIRGIRTLILTARTEEADVIQGLEAGADDYMKKPFSPRELVARVGAQFRRRELETTPPARVELPAGIELDLDRLEVHRDDKVIALTPREGDILRYLIQHRDKVVTRDDLLTDVWHYSNGNVETRTVDIHIVGLRRKVEPDPAKPSLIQTVRGRGYRWYA